jgi:hypothetical protein
LLVKITFHLFVRHFHPIIFAKSIFADPGFNSGAAGHGVTKQISHALYLAVGAEFAIRAD